MRTSAHCAILRVKSPPHLEPWDTQWFLERGFAAKRRENASAPQNGISSQTQRGIQPQGFQNHIPARGRKLHRIELIVHVIVEISKPYPRKGTETSPPSAQRRLPPHFKTISPQGDGNKWRWCPLEFFSLFQNHIPARGRKLEHPFRIEPRQILISKPYPRKGTETPMWSKTSGTR